MLIWLIVKVIVEGLLIVKGLHSGPSHKSQPPSLYDILDSKYGSDPSFTVSSLVFKNSF